MNIHATCISYHKKGILIIGKSGSGKSDLALRMIMQKDAKLVSDDRVDIVVEIPPLCKGEARFARDLSLSKSGEVKDYISIIASSPSPIAGLLEVRGLGIKKFPYIKKQKIHLVIELAANLKEIERLPEGEFYELSGIKIKKIKLYPFELSSLEKVQLACYEL